jgi:periplasmic chaperone LolA
MLGLLLLALSSAHAEPEFSRLHAFFDGMRTVSGEFEQTVFDSDFRAVQASSGVFMVQRPRKFRWDYHSPYEQLIMSDGEKLWIYDSDLAQVSVKSLDESLSHAPARLLSGEQPIRETFELTALGSSKGYEWVQLRPRVKDTEFNEVRLGLGPKGLAVMELVDGFGQTTRLRFTNLKRNPELNPALFKFVPPAGVDVIGAD